MLLPTMYLYLCFTLSPLTLINIYRYVPKLFISEYFKFSARICVYMYM